MKRWFILACLTILLVLQNSAYAADIKVYAASSMTNVINEVIREFNKKHSVKVVPIYGGSSSLARQIINGAPADIFISANSVWMDFVVKDMNLKGDDVTNLVTNQLVVITPSTSKINKLELSNLTQWQMALDGGRLAMGDPTSVPAGIYAKQALTALSHWSDLEGFIAPTKSVRLALALVSRGESPLGIVYKTDAQLIDTVKVVGEFNQGTHDKIVYPAAIIKQSEQATLFFDFLRSDSAKHIFNQYGFQ
ncbi:molybdate ABC transporter substrate-binding protein [Vibrio azureus]|uniref:Molybdate ABC transporter substrate-binding protein n=1 Tax=Vibrio azureus NBRC 104587 TaxID=1219077 RepID=U3C969_9VIBR|nr:molybdate ABC transporter substrate-binding protein [Vibrio azureus]AUI88229.1 molybdate ABC transporter substrate-binding protein [Vibrio azureus]GAD77904.1 molybdate ABC transporter substrate-binding protein [Vibrio azureus NBRC 104587]